jgi:hypothetical protein
MKGTRQSEEQVTPRGALAVSMANEALFGDRATDENFQSRLRSRQKLGLQRSIPVRSLTLL